MLAMGDKGTEIERLVESIGLLGFCGEVIEVVGEDVLSLLVEMTEHATAETIKKMAGETRMVEGLGKLLREDSKHQPSCLVILSNMYI